MFATGIQRWAYRHVAKPIFFRRDPEIVHDAVSRMGTWLGRLSSARALTRALYRYEHPALEQTVLGISFKNPIGLTAGFDKNGELTRIMPSVGFGFEEVGSVTGEPCAGNPKPRLWRLPKTRGLVVNYGLKNDGADVIARRLRGEHFAFPVGISIAKTNDPTTVEIKAGIADYEKAFRAFTDIGAYLAVNISCPNAYGGEPFTDPVRLEALLSRLDGISYTKPVFLKMPVDITVAELDALVAVVDRHRIHGFILSNLTKKRDRSTIVPQEIAHIPKGGVSGKPVQAPSDELIAHLYRTVGSRYVIIGSGGVFSAEDAYEKIRRGASLIQLATGMIFEGPQLIGEINRGLVRLLRRDGFSNVSEAVGAAHRGL